VRDEDHPHPLPRRLKMGENIDLLHNKDQSANAAREITGVGSRLIK
jgi:hypothetical protein